MQWLGEKKSHSWTHPPHFPNQESILQNDSIHFETLVVLQNDLGVQLQGVPPCELAGFDINMLWGCLEVPLWRCGYAHGNFSPYQPIDNHHGPKLSKALLAIMAC